MLLACSGGALAQRAPTPAAPSQGSPPKTSAEEKIPDNYIVVLKDDAAQDPEQVTNTRAQRGGQDPTQVAAEQARRHGLTVRHVYQNTIKGYAAVIPEGELEEVENDPRVDFVEQDQVVRATAQRLPWGINRIDADLSSTTAGDGSDSISNVNAYIIDTGIYKHGDLNVVKHVNFTGGKNRKNRKNTDCHGHGTHVAGTVAAKDNSSYVVGAAPGAPLTGVKVLGCNGSGTTSRVIKGIDWVTANADVNGPDNELGTSDDKPAVANMSLGGGASRALDDAVRRSARSGIFYAVAAGNNGKNACNYSPARAGTDNGVMTVAATNSSDAETSWSNYGSCVDLWAPGASILSTKRGGGTTTMSGTSMASPHGAGGGALYLSKNTTKIPAEVESALKSAATTTSNKSKDDKTTIVRENVGSM
jgi:subtilisin family serine protease